MRSSATSSRWERVSNGSGRAIGSAFPGSAGPAASACIAAPGARTCASGRASPAITIDGGYAEFTRRRRALLLSAPGRLLAMRQAAPLLCAGLIGYRALRMAGDARRLGIYGFGAAAHIIAQVARHQGRQVFAFTRAGDAAAQDFARGLGAVWAGGSDEMPPEQLDAALIFAPVGALVPAALKAIVPGRHRRVRRDPHERHSRLSLRLLWEERSIRSVANLTRQDAQEFLALAAEVPIATETHSFSLQRANEALDGLRRGAFTGAAVLLPGC